jgi:hypothetical protein
MRDVMCDHVANRRTRKALAQCKTALNRITRQNSQARAVLCLHGVYTDAVVTGGCVASDDCMTSELDRAWKEAVST